LEGLLAAAETAFLASISPDGQPDVSHRGGPPGFLALQPLGEVRWSEFVGDGMLKSAGNIRATGSASLLVLDLDSGDAAQLSGRATYRTLRTAKEARRSGLEQHKDPFPVQGEMVLGLEQIRRLHEFTSPRRRVERAEKITSCSPLDEQAPR
jgi:hypothetical protein